MVYVLHKKQNNMHEMVAACGIEMKENKSEIENQKSQFISNIIYFVHPHSYHIPWAHQTISIVYLVHDRVCYQVHHPNCSFAKSMRASVSLLCVYIQPIPIEQLRRIEK